MKHLRLPLLLLGIGLAACATPDRAREYTELVANAENEIKLAAATGFLWTSTEKFLEDSKTAYRAGDLEQAIKLAQRARDEAMLAQKQARSNANPKVDYSFKK